MGNTTAHILVQTTEIAAMMGAGWSAEPSPHDHMRNVQAILKGPQGELVTVKFSHSAPGRLLVRGRFGSDLMLPSDARVHEITVSRERSAGEIAGDITRRLLPGYRELLATLTAAKVERDRFDASVRAVVAQLAAIVGLDKVHGAHDAPGVYIDANGIKGDAYVERGGTVRFEITMTAAVGLRLAATMVSGGVI
jgi:hypothetical protein